MFGSLSAKLGMLGFHGGSQSCGGVFPSMQCTAGGAVKDPALIGTCMLLTLVLEHLLLHYTGTIERDLDLQASWHGRVIFHSHMEVLLCVHEQLGSSSS